MMAKFEFDAIGTSWVIDTDVPLSALAQRAILDRIECFDATYSRFRNDSLVARISTAEDGGRFEFPHDDAPLFDLYDRLFAVTDGAVDPLVGRDLELLGYDASYSLRHDPLAIARYSRQRRKWADDILRQRSSVVTRRSVVIDVGAAGKGYLVDVIADMLRAEGVGTFTIDGSGDLFHVGPTPLDVGLEHPADASLLVGIGRIKDGALCASATNRRSWGPFHPVIDGRTGVPVRDVIATWVAADSAMTADGLATALFFTSAERLAETFQFSYIRMFKDGRAEISPDFDGELFT
jgi:FAD:protein FMN transferase